MYNRFMDLVEANKQRDHERRMARRERIKRAVGWTAVGAVAMLVLGSTKVEVVVKDN